MGIVKTGTATPQVAKTSQVATPEVQTRSEVEFASVEDFKSHIGASTLEVLRNPSTGKLFMSSGSQNFKVQGSIDLALPLRVLIPKDGGIDEACLINANSANVLGTL